VNLTTDRAYGVCRQVARGSRRDYRDSAASAVPFVMTLNDEGTWKKRLAVTLSIMVIVTAIDFADVTLFGVYFNNPLDEFGFAYRQSSVYFIVEGIASLLIKNFRENAPVLPSA